MNMGVRRMWLRVHFPLIEKWAWLALGVAHLGFGFVSG